MNSWQVIQIDADGMKIVFCYRTISFLSLFYSIVRIVLYSYYVLCIFVCLQIIIFFFYGNPSTLFEQLKLILRKGLKILGGTKSKEGKFQLTESYIE